ncbi:torsin-1A-like [Amphibalanus amphitrite]|uniref:torsin-1A-like n=1 Tax=Amphibalanus amphitrite TaxID=1232801 RepID=UPI001C91EDAB|nr:torsin-1A-like [Amphibalanus amphitrite]XP_043205555.1 torsin-1A-like [Amphibalanus amphitrite]XP_043205556.1 torsin-1A-like [Amphibalanus amphitrite]
MRRRGWALPGLLTLLVAAVGPSAAIDPWSVAGAVGAIGGLSYVWESVRDTALVRQVARSAPVRAVECTMRECCDEPYIRRSVPYLGDRLREVVHGQHLVAEVIPRVISNHLHDQRPRKPLVISMHGTTGVGKNHVSRVVAESLYQRGMQSRFVHLYVGSLDFPYSDEESIQRYSDTLRRAVLGNLTRCERSLFIFDEVDKMPPGVLSGIRSLMDFHGSLHGVDVAGAIFILLSNTGGLAINAFMLQQWRDGVARDQVTIAAFQPVMEKRAFSETGGLYKSDIVSAALVDLYLPFLPLERQHVRLCVLDELRRRGVSTGQEEAVQHVLRQVRFDTSEQVFARVGCKDVANKVNMVLDHSMFEET